MAQGQRESGLQWKKDNNIPFRLVIDEERKLYRQFGLGREVKLVWTLEAFAFYAAEMIAGGPDKKGMMEMTWLSWVETSLSNRVEKWCTHTHKRVSMTDPKWQTFYSA